MKKYKSLVIIILFLLGLVTAWWMGYKTNLFQTHAEESSVVLLDKIEKVIKFVAVEGNLTEIYDYKDYYSFDIAPFRKKALVRVNAKVSAGYNFENLVIDLDEENKVIVIKHFPDAEILSIDHDLDYYDLTQGTFNRFTAEDYNKINSRAKAFIAEKARDSGLIETAGEQKEELIDMVKMLVNAGGWELRIEKIVFLD